MKVFIIVGEKKIQTYMTLCEKVIGPTVQI